MSKKNGGKKNRKVGRDAIRCRAYTASNRREKNKVKRLARHLKNFPGDGAATAAVDRAKIAIRGY